MKSFIILGSEEGLTSFDTNNRVNVCGKKKKKENKDFRGAYVLRMREKTPSPISSLFMLFLESKVKVSAFLSNELLARDQLYLNKHLKGRKYNVTLNCKLGVTLQLINLLQV